MGSNQQIRILGYLRCFEDFHFRGKGETKVIEQDWSVYQERAGKRKKNGKKLYSLIELEIHREENETESKGIPREANANCWSDMGSERMGDSYMIALVGFRGLRLARFGPKRSVEI